MKAPRSSRSNGIGTSTFTSKLIEIKLTHQIYFFVKITSQLFPRKYSAYTYKKGRLLMTSYGPVTVTYLTRVYSRNQEYKSPQYGRSTLGTALRCHIFRDLSPRHQFFLGNENNFTFSMCCHEDCYEAQ